MVARLRAATGGRPYTAVCLNLVWTNFERVSPERELFLAIAQDVYEDFFSQPAVQDIVIAHEMHLLVFEPAIGEVVQWIS